MNKNTNNISETGLGSLKEDEVEMASDQNNIEADNLPTTAESGDNSNGINPDFEFESNGIGLEDIKADADKNRQELINAERDGQNPFPVEVFPKPVQQIINSAKECLTFPVDFLGSSMLYTSALAIGNTHKIEVKKNWTENAVLYIALVGSPGTNKSHPLTFALKPIQNADNESYKEYELQKAEYDREIARSKLEGQSNGELKAPVWKKFLIGDHTPEALVEKHNINKRGIGVCSDELAGWFNNFNRYHKGGEQEFWLSIWSGKPINIDRKSSEPIYLPHPFIPVIGTIQTGILHQLSKGNRSENGFIARLLFAMPDNLQKQHWNEKEIEPTIIDNWDQIVTNLLNLPLELDANLNPDARILRFTPEAHAEYKRWYDANADLLNETENEAIQGIYAKADMFVARFALILQLMSWACNKGDKQAVEIDAIKGALKLFEYFRNTAIKVHGIISKPLDRLSGDKRKLYESLPDRFNTQEAIAKAEEGKMPARNAERFLADKEYFKKTKRGEYEKRYK